MRLLKFGCEGDDVVLWELFLKGQYINEKLIVDDYFGKTTEDLTKKFQADNKHLNLTVDGIVGKQTYAAAMLLGYDLQIDDDRLDVGPNFPPRPNNVKTLTINERKNIFGDFAFKAAPTKNNPEAIKILDGWEKTNIVKINIPQLKNVDYAPKSGDVYFHVKIADQIRSFFNELEKLGLNDKVLTWGGSWVPRFIRGSNTTLSNHAWGTAFDVNVPFNALGTTGALLGEKGSVRELVTVAHDHGLFWGAHYHGRKDPMHFEIYKIL